MNRLTQLFKTLYFIYTHPLNKKTKGGISRFIRYQLSIRLLKQGLVLPFVDDTKLLVYPGMTGATGNYYCGLHEFEDMAFLLHFLNETDIFCDIGANIGSYSILASGVCGAETYCFEPCPKTFQSLCNNININHLNKKIYAFMIAIGNETGNIKFTINNDTANHVVIQKEVSEPVIDVPILRAENILGNKIPRLIKIDTEGFETEVIKGMHSILAHPDCKALIVEVTGGERYGFNQDILHQYILRYGFKESSYNVYERKIEQIVKSKSQNNLYVKDIAFTQSRINNAKLININGYMI